MRKVRGDDTVGVLGVENEYHIGLVQILLHGSGLWNRLCHSRLKPAGWCTVCVHDVFFFVELWGSGSSTISLLSRLMDLLS